MASQERTLHDQQSRKPGRATEALRAVVSGQANQPLRHQQGGYAGGRNVGGNADMSYVPGSDIGLEFE